MKLTAILLAATAAVAAADNCDVVALGPVVLGANGKQCTADSGMSFLPPVVPSADIVKKLCASSACKALLGELKKAAPSECTVDIANPPLQLYAQLLTPLETTCEGPAPTTAPGPTTAAPGPTTAAPGPTTAAPGPTTPDATTETPETTTNAPEATTEAPEATTAAPAGDSASSTEGSADEAGSGSADAAIDEISATEAPSTQSTPTTAPTDSGASTLVAAASAVVVALAASFF